MPDIKLIVDVDIDESSEKFEESLKQVIKNVEDKIPQIKLNFDSDSLKDAVDKIEKTSKGVKGLGDAAKKSAQSASSGFEMMSDEVKTLSENIEAFQRKENQVNKALESLYEMRRKFSGAQAKDEMSLFAYEDIKKAISGYEQLKSVMGGLTSSDFDRVFLGIKNSVGEATKTLSEFDSKTKLVTEDVQTYESALTRISDLRKRIATNADRWTAASAEGSKSGDAYKVYTAQIAELDLLEDRVRNTKLSVRDLDDSFASIKSTAKQAAETISRAGEATKTAVGAELVSGTKEYEDALRKVDTVITTISTNTKNWTAASEGTAKSAYASYSGLVDELNTVHKCIETGQLTREEFQLWMSQIGSKAAAAAKEIKLAGENMKLPETLEVGSKKYSSALNTVNGLLKQVESNTKKWTLAQNGNSKKAYEDYTNQATALRDLSEKLRTGKMSEAEFNEELDKIVSTMRTSENIIRENGEATSQLSNKFSILDTTLGKTAIRLASMYLGFQKFVQLAKQMVQNSIEIESAMNRLQIVTGATDREMKYFFSEAASQAKELGKNIVDVAGSIETFSRLGYSLSESSTLSKFATIMANVADTTVDKATTGLTSIIKGYGLQVSEAEHVADVLVNVGQKYAISAEELMEAFERGGAALHASGASFEQSAALFAATNAALQNAANVGTMWKTVSARIRGSKTELDELGESMDDLVGGFSKYREEIKALSGVDIMIDDSHFKDTYEIFVELANVWDKMEGDTARARIAEILGGTRQLSGIASTIQNISDAIGAYNTALDSNSVAVAANNKYMETTAAHIEQLKTSFQELSYDFFNSDLIKNGVDFLKGFVEVVDFLTKHIGSLNTALIGIGAVKGIKALMKNFSGFKDYISMFRDISNTGDLISHLGTGFEALAGSIGVSASALGSFLIVVGGIFIIRTAIDLLTTSYEELRDQATRTSQALKSTQSEIADVESKIEETRASIEKLEGKHLDAVEQASYDRLVQYNDQLEIQLQLLKDTETIQKEAARDAAVAALTSKSFTPLQPTDLIGKIEAETWRIKDMELNNVPATDATYVQWLANRADHIKEAMGYFDSIRDYEGELTGEIKDLYDKFLLAVENSKSDEKIAQEKAEKKTKAIQSILSQYSTVYKAIKDMAENKPYGISMSDVYSVSSGGFADAISSAGATMVDVANEINKTNGALDEAEVDKGIKQLFHYSTLVSGAGTGVEQAFKAFKGMSDAAQVAAYNALKGGGIDLSSWELPDFEYFFGTIADNLINGQSYIEYATDNFEQLDNDFEDFTKEAEKYLETVDTLKTFNVGTGNSITPNLFFDDLVIRNIQEEIEALSLEGTEEAAKKIKELQKELADKQGLKDYAIALEYNNGRLSYNLDLVNEITEAKKNEAIATANAEKALKREQYLENAKHIQILRREIEDTTISEEKLNKQLEIESLLSQNSSLANQIQRYDILRHNISEATDAYHDWINAQKAAQSGDMFDEAVKAFELIDDTFNDTTSQEHYLKTGNVDYLAAVKFVVPDTVSKEDEEKVKEYYQSIKKYFTTNEKGELKGLNVQQFYKDAIDAKLMTSTQGENGKTYYQILGERSMQEFADGMKLSLPFVQAIFGELEEYNQHFTWRDDEKSLEDLKVDAIEAAEALKELGNLKGFEIGADSYEHIKEEAIKFSKEASKGGGVDLTLRPTIDTKLLLKAGWEDAGEGAATIFSSTFSNKAAERGKKGGVAINFTPIMVDKNGNYAGVLSPEELERYAQGVINGTHSDYLNLQIGAAFTGKNAIAQATEAAEQIHKAQEIIYTTTDETDSALYQIEQKIREIQQFKAKPDIDGSSIENANRIIEYLIAQKQTLEAPAIMGVDISNVEEKYQAFIKKLREFHEAQNSLEMQVALEMDENTINASEERVNKLAQEIAGLNTDLEIGLEDTSVKGIEEYIKSLNKKENFVKFGVKAKEVERFADKRIENTNSYVVWKNDTTAVDEFMGRQLIKNATVKVQTDTSGYVIPKLPRAYKSVLDDDGGLAYANGTTGAKHSGKTLMGELGEEVYVNPHTGKWYTAGTNGPEFVYLPKDAIVFNHEQTASLFRNGKTNTRGKSMATGNALGGGSVSGGGSMSAFPVSDPLKETKKQNSENKAREKVVKTVSDTGKTLQDTSKNIENETDTILEDFRKWFGSLFDWVEVRISRLTDKIEKTVEKAERNLTKGNYNRAASNYNSAINKTMTLLENEESAVERYALQASRVIEQAKSRGVINSTMATTITNNDIEGIIDIVEYNDRVRAVVDEYQNWTDKAREASSAVSELHDKIVGYVKSLKEVRDAQRDAKLGQITNRITFGNGSNAGSYASQNAQLSYGNTQLKAQNKAYSTAVKNSGKDLKKLKASSNKAINERLGPAVASDKSDKYAIALKKAQDLMSKNQKIPASILKTVGENSVIVYNRLVAYNLGLENANVAREENALNYVANSAERYSNISKKYENNESQIRDNISLLTQMSENASTALKANRLLDNVAKQYDDILSNDRKEINTFKKSRQSNQSLLFSTEGRTKKAMHSENGMNQKVNRAVDEVHSIIRRNESIPPKLLNTLANYYSKGYLAKNFYNACINYNNAIEAENQAKAAYKVDKQATKATLAELGVQKLQNVQNAYGLQQSTISSSKGVVSARQSLRSTKGISMGRADYKTLRNYAHKEQLSLEKERASLKSTIRANLKSGLWTKDMKEYKEALNTVRELEASILKSKEEQVEYNNAIAQLPYDTIEKAIDKYDALGKYLDSVVAREQARSNDLEKWNYTTRINANAKMIEQYTKEREQALADYGKALANKDNVYGGKTADEWLELYRNIGVSINNLIADNEKLADEMRDDIYWRTYERVHESAKRLQNVLSGISELMSDDMYFSKDGMITQFGVTKIAELTKQYELAGTEVKNYTADIENLNKLYKDGQYTEQEYIAKLADLRDGLLDSAKSMKQYLDSIKDMYKTIAQEELDRLFALIDKRAESLDKRKSIYDYSKSVNEKAKDVRSLQSQLAAIEGVNTTEAKAQRARLQAQLAEANEALAETQRDHEIELSKESLDGMKTTLQEEFDNKWDNLSQDLDAMKSLLEQANRLTEASTSTIDKTLDAILSHYGIDSELVPHASGSKRVRNSHVGLSMEKGNELLVTKYGIISKFNPGDGIIPADLTERLYTLAQGIKPGMSASKFHGLKQNMNGVEVTQNYGSLINIEGSADAATVEDLKNMSKDLLERSYNYTSKRMTQDYARTGGRRKI